MALTQIGAQAGTFDGDSIPVGSALTVEVGDVVFLAIAQRFQDTLQNFLVHGTSTATATVSTVTSSYNATALVSTSIGQYVVTGAGSLVVSPNFLAADDGTYLIAHWRGADTSTPVVGSAVGNAGTLTNTFTGSAATPGKAGDFVLSFAYCGQSFPTLTATSTWTQGAKRDGASTFLPNAIYEYKEAPSTSTMTSAPTSSLSTAEYLNTTIVLNAATATATIARGLYL